jgi:hypothetical protein
MEMTGPNTALWSMVVVCGGLLAATQCRAETMPAALRGESIILNWSDARTIRDDSGRQKDRTQTSEIRLYVSDQGRVFSRLYRSTGPKDTKTISEVSGVGSNYLHWRFEGDSLVADQHFDRGARRVAVSFSDGFRACSITVLHGKEAGAEAIRYTGYDDNIQYEIVAIRVTAANCSMRQGNVFADPQ